MVQRMVLARSTTLRFGVAWARPSVRSSEQGAALHSGACAWVHAVVCLLCHPSHTFSTLTVDLQAAAALSRRWCAGCTIAILVERGQAYFAHIRPRSSAPNAHLAGQANWADLAYNMQQFGGFDGQGLTDRQPLAAPLHCVRWKRRQ